MTAGSVNGQLQESDTRELTRAEIDDVLTREGMGVLALPDEREPYLVPMSYGYDGSSSLYFIYLRFGDVSRKLELSDSAVRGSFLVYSVTSKHEWHSVRVAGVLGKVPAAEWPEARAAIEDNAWYPSLFSSASPTGGIEGFSLVIDDASGLASTT